MHEPLKMEHPDKASIVVFIHGFMGSPRQFDSMAEVAYDNGHSVLSLLLPGHGYGLKEFSSATMEDWVNWVNAEINRLSPHYKSIFIVGHSLGCLLAITASLEHREHVRGIFLIFCPFKLGYLSFGAIKTRLKRLFYKKSNPVKQAYITACSIPLSPSLVFYSIKPAAELKKLRKITISKLKHIHVPVTAIYSSSDEVVFVGSLEILKSNANQTTVKSVLLTDSQHAYFPEHERAVIERALLEALH